MDERAVCSLAALKLAGRLPINVKGREVLIVYYKENIYAVDRQCYHAGGPLQDGTLKDIEERPCLVCPWHKYTICLDSGEGLYQHIDPKHMEKPPVWKSKGVKQRTHKVTTDGDQVYIELSDLSVKIDSDHYSSEEYRKLMGIGNPK